MGLDIYLYTRDQHLANERHDEASEAFYSREDWPSEGERRAALDALPPYVGYTKVPSEKHPDHLFDRRYLRSSYNGSGFDRAVPEMVGEEHGLDWIFEPVRSEDDYETVLTESCIWSLGKAKERALQVVEELRGCDPLRTLAGSALFGPPEHMWSQPPTQEQVLDWYRSEKEKNGQRDDTWGEGYSNAKGTVLGFTKGLEVLAVTLGRDVLGRPAAVVVFRANEQRDYLVQSAEIVAEFCDEAISLIKADGKCYMHWSG